MDMPFWRVPVRVLVQFKQNWNLIKQWIKWLESNLLYTEWRTLVLWVWSQLINLWTSSDESSSIFSRFQKFDRPISDCVKSFLSMLLFISLSIWAEDTLLTSLWEFSDEMGYLQRKFISTAWGEVISERRVRDIAQEFREIRKKFWKKGERK